MSMEATTCPAQEELESFLCGDLAGPEAERVGQHLLRCEACCRIARRASCDVTFVDAIKDVSAGDALAEQPAVAELIQRLVGLGQPLEADGNNRTLLAVGDGQATAEHPELDAPLLPTEMGRIGGYSILHVLGAGGMGTVYLAEQARPRRLVALKMLAPVQGGSHSRGPAEADVIARLAHPHIVQVHEVGEHRGRSYFTMELADQGNLAQQLRQEPPSVRRAAELIATLARAVHYAHQQGVVHRDLKPSNVLVFSSGQVKIADFGLARLAAAEGADAASRTESGAILGTPSYMAPEQAWGQRSEIGPATDIYALGAILYQLLTGRPPFQAGSALKTLEELRSQEPVAPGRLNRSAPRDLQTICLKCLEKAPLKRYGTAQELGDDLDRFLRDEPIRARPVGRLTRGLKWAGRRPALAGLILVSSLALAVIVAGMLLYNAQLRTTAEEALRQQARADSHYRAARAALQQMLKRLDEQPLDTMPQAMDLRRRILEDVLDFYQSALADQNSPDPRVRLDAAWYRKSAADLQQQLGRTAAAVENLQAAVALLEDLPPSLRESSESQRIMASCNINLGSWASDQQRWEDAERFQSTAARIYQRLSTEDPKTPEWQGGLALCEHHLGVGFQLRKRPLDAEPHYSKSRVIWERLVHDHPEEAEYQRGLADTYVNLALLYQGTGRSEEVTPIYEKAEPLLRNLAEHHPRWGLHALSLAALYSNWSYHLRAQNQFEAALQRNSQAVELAEKVYSNEPQHGGARMRSLQAHGARTETLEAMNRWADAVKDWDRVVELDDGNERWRNRVLRARALAHAHQHERVAAEADDLVTISQVSPEGRYELARALARGVRAARQDERLASPDRLRLVDRYGKCAVELLSQLQQQHFFKFDGRTEWLQYEPDLLPLHDRADFQRLLKDIAACELLAKLSPGLLEDPSWNILWGWPRF